MIKNLHKYIDAAYVLRFCLILLPLYFFHIFYNGLISPGGAVYSPFLENHFNYIDWLSKSILYSASFIDHIFGLQSYVKTDYLINGLTYIIKIDQGASIILWLPCLGLGIISFWIAFVTAHTGNWKKKIFWCLIGIITIWFINCWRIALLLFALQNNWRVDKYANNHDLFNFVAYAFIILMMHLYGKEHKKATYNSIALPNLT